MTTPTIVAHLADYAQVPARQLSDAKRVVARVYADAGVRLIWQGGSASLAARADALAGNPGPLHLDVVILSDDMIVSLDASVDVLGRAEAISRRAYIFHRRIADYAAASGNLTARVLAYVLAHEIGHIVLPGGHTPDGLMQASVQGSLAMPYFTRAQVQAMRSLLDPASRAEQAAADLVVPSSTDPAVPAAAPPSTAPRPVG